MSAMKQFSRNAGLAGLTLGFMALLPAPASAASRPEEGVISTQGSGQVRVCPDSLRVDIGAEAQAKTLEQAQTEVNRRIQRVLQALNKLRIPGLSLQTQTIQLSPIRETDARREPPRIIGYRAENSVQATLLGAAPDELGPLASRLVDTAIRAGSNTVSNIGFFVQNVQEAQDRALAAAVRDAERKARTMASAAGGTLGKLQSLESASSYQAGLEMRAFDAVAERTPVATGERVITSNVSARFRFANR
jgi:uncharacterized protein